MGFGEQQKGSGQEQDLNRGTPSNDSLAQIPGSKPAEDGKDSQKNTSPGKKVAENFEEYLSKKEEESRKRLDKLYEKRVSNAKLPEKAIAAMNDLKREQAKKIGEIMQKYKRDYELRTSHGNSLLNNFRIQLAEELGRKAAKEAEDYVAASEALFSRTVKGDFITPEEIVKLEQATGQIDDLIKKDPKLNEIIQKLSKNMGLDAENYQKILELLLEEVKINPVNPKESFRTREVEEQSMAGTLIGLMRPDQRYTLIENLIESPKKNQSGVVIDEMLSHGLLTILQGKELLKLAVERKAVTLSEYQKYQEKFENGTYQVQVEKIKQDIKEKVEKLEGMFAVNPLQRALEGPLWGTLMKTHAVLWFLANFLANHDDHEENFGKKLWNTMEMAAKNPYTYAAVGEFLLGHEIDTGGRKAGSDAIGSGDVTLLFQNIAGFFKKEPSQAERVTLMKFYNVYSNYPEFSVYLEQGGAADIHALYREKKEKKQPLQLDSQELMQRNLTKDREKAKLFEKAKNKFPKATEEHINIVAQTWEDFGIKDNLQFQEFLKTIRETQGVKKEHSKNL